MNTRRLSDAQWALLAPHLPPQSVTGRPRADDRRTLDAILLVLRSGCRWGDVPRELGDGSTAWRRLQRWEADGTWERLWRLFLASLAAREKLSWAEAFLDGTFVPAKKGGPVSGSPAREKAPS
jgi:transposase